MSSNFGNHLQISIFGESHNDKMGVIINGLKAGLELDIDLIKSFLNKRRPYGFFSTSRVEEDDFEIVSGYFNGFTTGAPLCVLLNNKNIKSTDYSEIKDLLRPSHADYSAYLKYNGYQDYRGGGHFSGRITALLVIVGAICTQILYKKNVYIGSHIKSLKNIHDIEFDYNNLKNQIVDLNDSNFATLSAEVREKMIDLINNTKDNQDSVGGIIETVVIGTEGGIGEPFFNSCESILSHLLFSIPAVKGVEFGAGFDITSLYGSEANDSFTLNKEICTTSNKNGGINGGITNGMPIIIKTAIKPTSSIGKPQHTVNIKNMSNEILEIKGRHDPAIVHRARIVVDSMVAIGLVELYLSKYGYDWMEV